MNGFMGPGDTVPPNLRSPLGVPNDEMPLEDMEAIECLAVGTFKEIEELDIEIVSVCQRATDPCIVEIEYTVTGNGVYDLYEPWTAFSLDSTNGINGTWHLLVPLRSDDRHTTNFPAPDLPGGEEGDRIESWGQSKTERFVADMCSHLTTFMSEPKIVFRITYEKAWGFYGPGDTIPPGVR